MEINVSSLEDAITRRLGATYVEVHDMSGRFKNYPSCSTNLSFTGPNLTIWILSSKHTGGCGQIFEATIVSPEFKGKMTLARHRLVNTALKEEISKVHAWTQKCFTEEEWEKKKEKDAAAAAAATTAA